MDEGFKGRYDTLYNAFRVLVRLNRCLPPTGYQENGNVVVVFSGEQWNEFVEASADMIKAIRMAQSAGVKVPKPPEIKKRPPKDIRNGIAYSTVRGTVSGNVQEGEAGG